MTNDEHIEEVGMTIAQILEQFLDKDAEKQISKIFEGKPVMTAHTTLCYIIGVCISRTSESQEAAQHAMDMCGNMIAQITTADHNSVVAKKEAGDDPNHTPTTRLQ